jgi:hypothetical protein
LVVPEVQFVLEIPDVEHCTAGPESIEPAAKTSG